MIVFCHEYGSQFLWGCCNFRLKTAHLWEKTCWPSWPLASTGNLDLVRVPAPALELIGLAHRPLNFVRPNDLCLARALLLGVWNLGDCSRRQKLCVRAAPGTESLTTSRAGTSAHVFTRRPARGWQDLVPGPPWTSLLHLFPLLDVLRIPLLWQILARSSVRPPGRRGVVWRTFDMNSRHQTRGASSSCFLTLCSPFKIPFLYWALYSVTSFDCVSSFFLKPCHLGTADISWTNTDNYWMDPFLYVTF